MRRGADREKLESWAERLTRFQQSGMSVARFCQAEGISQSSFYQWKRKLDKPKQRKSKATKAARHEFLAVEVAPRAMSQLAAASTVRLGCGVEIELGSDLRVVDAIVKQVLQRAAQSEPTPGGRSC